MNINNSVKSVIDFLGEKRIEKLKDYVVDSLCENLQDSIDEHWLVIPDIFDEVWDDLFEECKATIKKKYKKIITDEISKRIDLVIYDMKGERSKGK